MQPETLQSLIDRLNSTYINESQFKDIQIKAVELIKQLFPYDSASAVYQINMLRLTSKPFYESITEFRSILEAKLQTIIRAEQSRIAIEKQIEAIKKQQEENRIKASQVKENEYVSKLMGDLNRAYDDLSKAYDNNKELHEVIEFYKSENFALEKKASTRYKNHYIKDLVFWSVIIAICALFLFVGYYFGNARFDSEKFALKEQRDNYKRQVDSLTKLRRLKPEKRP